MLLLAVAVLALCVTLLLVLWLRGRAHWAAELAAARADLGAMERQSEILHQRIDSLEDQLREQVAGRLPKPLLPLQVDSLIDLSGVMPALRNVLFTRVGSQDHPMYEYRLTCRNDRSESLQPRYALLVFSKAGIQTGSADVTDSPDWTRLGAGGLPPGESCSFSGRLELRFRDDPEYFLILDLQSSDEVPLLGP